MMTGFKNFSLSMKNLSVFDIMKERKKDFISLIIINFNPELNNCMIKEDSVRGTSTHRFCPLETLKTILMVIIFQTSFLELTFTEFAPRMLKIAISR